MRSKLMRVSENFEEYTERFRRDLEKALHRKVTKTEATDAIAQMYGRHRPVVLWKQKGKKRIRARISSI